MTDDANAVVFIIDDDESLRGALAELLASVGLRAETFAAPKDFLRNKVLHRPSCLVLDVRLPGLSGLDLQAELAKADTQIPIIFISGHGDIPMSVKAIKAGAAEFLTKPLHEQEFLDAVQRALELDRIQWQERESVSILRARFDALTARERQILGLVIGGQLNKQIANTLGLSEITVKVHRASAMRKVGAKSLVELLAMAHTLQLGPAKG